jgi:uncharacterized sulfatase
MNPPHSPYHLVPERYKSLYEGKSAEELLVRPNVDLGSESSKPARAGVADYFAMVSGVDEQFGRILDALESQGIADNTIVVFTSDHGEMMGGQGRMSKNVWNEESLNIPFLVRYPRAIQPGEDDLILGTPDIFPSLLSLMQLHDKIPESVEGFDRSGILTDGAGKRPDAGLYMRAIPSQPEKGIRGMRTHQHTYPPPQGSKTPALLFDNVSDPYQQRSLIGESGMLETELKQ